MKTILTVIAITLSTITHASAETTAKIDTRQAHCFKAEELEIEMEALKRTKYPYVKYPYTEEEIQIIEEIIELKDRAEAHRLKCEKRPYSSKH